MKTPKTTIWKMHELTPIKHRILRGYLERWLPTLLSQFERVYILDGFCGPGEYVGGKIGSPLIAIDALRRCTSALEQQRKVTFLFIDNNNRRCSHLYNLIDKQAQSANINISHYIETGDF